MDRTRVVAALLAVLAVLALSVAAATLESSTDAGQGAGTGPEGGVGAGEGESFDLGSANVSDTGGQFSVPPILVQIAMALVLLLSAVGFVQFYLDYGLRGLVAMVGLVVGFVAVVTLFFAFVDLGDLFDREGVIGLFGENAPSVPGGGSPGDVADVASTPEPSLAVVALLGAVLVGGVLVVIRASGDANIEVAAPAPPEEPTVALGQAAGRAADRIAAAGADLDNEVYRAWREMTGHLDVENPAASTPAEFADAAVAAGMDREDVAELTELFEAVRYGGAAVTEDREERAVAALRRIEREYARE